MSRKGQELHNQYRIKFVGLRLSHRNPSLSLGAKVILIDLLLYAGVDGVSFPSQETLAANHNLTSRQIRNLLNELKKAGLVSWRRRGFPASNIYTFSQEIYFPTDESNRKYSSSKIGSPVPLELGNSLPTNEINEGKQLISSHIQQLFENTSNTKLNRTEVNNLHKLCDEYTEQWVEDAIKEAGSRNLPFIKVGLIGGILGDWKQDGKPPSKPIFTACNENGCENGYLFPEGSGSVCLCECRENFENELLNWKQQWGGEYA